MTGIRTATLVSAVGVVIAASALLTGCVSNISGTAVRAAKSGPSDVPPLNESKLEDVLLSIGELNKTMGSKTMKITSDLNEMTDHSAEVSDPDCLGAVYGAEDPVYANSDWKAVRDQVAREPDDNNDHWVEQTVVLYPSANEAQKFLDDSKKQWQKCAGNALTVYDAGDSYLWEMDDVTGDNSMIIQMTTQEDADGWACQHAVSAVSNITVEAWACGYSIHDEAETIATDMIDNASKK